MNRPSHNKLRTSARAALRTSGIASATAAFLVCFALPSLAHAQGYGRVEEIASNGAYFHFVRPGVMTVQVYLMGPVGKPGVYELSEGTTIGQLLAFAGGPTMSPRPTTSRRTITIRMYRPAVSGSEPMLEASFDQIIGSAGNTPSLQDGDVLTVEIVEKQRFNWREGLTLIGSLSALGIVIQSLTGRR